MADHTIVSIEGIELVGQVRGKALEVSRIQNMQDSATVEDDSLYGTDDEIDISIIEMRNGDQKCRTFADIEGIVEFCEEERHNDTTWIILIPQTTSWGQLEISRPALQLLQAIFQISPDFSNLLELFGSKINADHESNGGMICQSWDESSKSMGISYCVKHAAEHGRLGCYDPWSMRQTGVHHQFHQSTGENIFMIVNANEPLHSYLETSRLCLDPVSIHNAIQNLATKQWSTYVDHLEHQCEDLSQIALLSNTKAKKTTIASCGFEVQFEDTQRIQRLQDIILRSSHMMDLNLSILFEIQQPSSLLRSAFRLSKTQNAQIQTLSSQTRVQKLRADNLLRRLDGISTLIRSILDALASQALQASSRTTTELAGLAREDAKINAIFAKKATLDGRTLKTITILTLIYLPATFVAVSINAETFESKIDRVKTLLGTQYIHIDPIPGQFTISIASEMWVFGILTIALLLMTIGIWLFWEWRNRLIDEATATKERSMI